MNTQCPGGEFPPQGPNPFFNSIINIDITYCYYNDVYVHLYNALGGLGPPGLSAVTSKLLSVFSVDTGYLEQLVGGLVSTFLIKGGSMVFGWFGGV